MKKLGVGIPIQTGHNPFDSLNLLGGVPMHWFNWSSNHQPGTAGYIPTLYKSFSNHCRTRMDSNPGELWLISNEGERADQVNKHPHYVGWDIKEALKCGVRVIGPNCLWTGSTYVRGYCEEVIWSVGLETFRELDAFGVHIYVPTTHQFDYMLKQVREFLDLMGLPTLPIAVTEFNATPVSNEQAQISLLEHVYRRLYWPDENEKIDNLQMALWFSSNYSRTVDGQWVDPPSNLLTQHSQLTPVGSVFKHLITS